MENKYNEIISKNIFGVEVVDVDSQKFILTLQDRESTGEAVTYVFCDFLDKDKNTALKLYDTFKKNTKTLVNKMSVEYYLFFKTIIIF